eukprot:TRINITY_DN2740_c0_g1_i1.p1 TRINITY_DN2740_c0_g1~~TRINITY_DN2740_c0_g1_i1.p1  ORF type:complete len:302 (-),score=83.65 TRINITY_DN2740_c0_g1_i1:55-960(-)
MTNLEQETFKAHVDRFTGFGKEYNKIRPSIPVGLRTLLLDLVGELRQGNEGKLGVVVDVGCGTGLSTFTWSEVAERVVGVDPTEDMLKQAVEEKKNRKVENVEFVSGYSHNIPKVEDNSVDLITASQSLHWMDLPLTFKEANRVLKPYGAFVGYDYDFPPTLMGGFFKSTEIVRDWMTDINKRGDEKEIYKGVVRGDKSKHLENMRKSGHFRMSGEGLFSERLEWKSDLEGVVARLMDLVGTWGLIQTALKAGVTTDAEVEQIRGQVRQSLIQTAKDLNINVEGERTWTICWFYRFRYGIK